MKQLGGADEKRESLEPLITKARVCEGGRDGLWNGNGEVLNGILWVLCIGAHGGSVPGGTPCDCRLSQWVREGIFLEIIQALAKDLREHTGLDLSVCSIDGSVASAKKGALTSGGPSAASGP